MENLHKNMNLYKNVNEICFHSHFYANFHAFVNLLFLCSDFHEIFTKMYYYEIGNNLHHFGNLFANL